MDVSYMLNLMGTLGIGEVQAVDSSTDIFLQYLNLANCELYREVASLNSDILINEMLNNVAGETTIQIAQTPFMITNIFPQGQVLPLVGKSILDFAVFKFENPSANGLPLIYCRQKTTINFFPSQANTVYTFNVYYVPEVTNLTQDTTEDQIPYPISYQQVLVDGALYYLFQDESGFKNSQKESQALRRWTKGKQDLTSYLRGANFQKITTFNNV